MKAAIYTRYGPPEVVSIRETDQPEPGKGEIKIKVHAATVNRTDCGFRSAEYFVTRFFSGLIRPVRRILGCEFAGEVAVVGEGVTGFRPGDRVFGYDDKGFGAHAEYKILSAQGNVALIPGTMGYTEAAALTEGSHYALCNIRAARIGPGDRAMVYGATGGIGSAAVQLLKYFGAYVVAVAATPHTELVRSLGADEVIDYQKEDFTRCGQTFDLVFDAVGKSSFSACKPLLKEKGKYIPTELGRGSENVFLALFTSLGGRKRVLFPIPYMRKEDVEFLGALAASGAFRPLKDREYALDDIVEAYRYVETGQKLGNVIIRVAGGD